MNSLYHAALVSGLSVGYAKLGQMFVKGPTPKLDLTVRDAGLLFIDVSLAVATKDWLIKHGILPSKITE